MPLQAEPIPIEDLILVRVACGHRVGLTWHGGVPEEQIRRELLPAVDHVLSESQWAVRLDELLKELRREGLMERLIDGLALTAAGRERAAAFMDIDDVPEAGIWSVLFETHVVPRALGVQEKNHVRAAEGLRVAILRKHYSLPLAADDSLRQAADALAWRLIGFDRKDAFTRSAVLATVLARALGQPERASAEPDEVLQQLVAQLIGARGTRVEELRWAAVRRVVSGLVPREEPPA